MDDSFLIERAKVYRTALTKVIDYQFPKTATYLYNTINPQLSVPDLIEIMLDMLGKLYGPCRILYGVRARGNRILSYLYNEPIKQLGDISKEDIYLINSFNMKINKDFTPFFSKLSEQFHDITKNVTIKRNYIVVVQSTTSQPVTSIISGTSSRLRTIIADYTMGSLPDLFKSLARKDIVSDVVSGLASCGFPRSFSISDSKLTGTINTLI